MRRTGRWIRTLAAGVDRALVSGVMTRPPRDQLRVDQEERARRLIPLLESLETQVARHADHGHWLEAPDAFFPRPAPIYPERSPAPSRLLRARELAAVDLRWRSKLVPHAPALAERWQRDEANRWAHARILGGTQPRPVIVLIHGYMGGHLTVEERLWPLDQFDALGLDVALFVLPHHGPRSGRAALRRPLFPSPDARLTVEGLRQAVFDLRALINILRREGHPAVGMAGMSLGGYLTALMATLEPDLSFALPIIPLSCFATWYRDQGALIGHPELRRRHLEAIEALTQVVSPLARPPAAGSRPDRGGRRSGRSGHTPAPRREASRASERPAAPLHRRAPPAAGPLRGAGPGAARDHRGTTRRMRVSERDDEALLSIYAGLGGADALALVEALYRLYRRYCTRRGWTLELVESVPGSAGGLESLELIVSGSGAYERLRHEQGLHRRRLPGGERTAVATVYVLPLRPGEEVRDEELLIDTFRQTASDGQRRLEIASEVQLTHLPSDLAVRASRGGGTQEELVGRARAVLATKLAARSTNGEVDTLPGDLRRTYEPDRGRARDIHWGTSTNELQRLLDGELELLEPAGPASGWS